MLLPQLLLKNINFLNNLNINKIFNRYRRIQTRKPIAVFDNYKDAAEKKTKTKKEKEEKKKEPNFENQKLNNDSKIKRLKFIIPNKNETNQERETNIDQKELFNKLQDEANRIYYKHDPYLTGKDLSQNEVDDITKNVDLLAAKLTNKEDILKKVLNLTDGDHRFGPQIQIAKSQRHRYEKKKILLEGKRLILDALESNVKIESLFLSKSTLIKELNYDFSKLNYDIKYFQITPRALSLWSDVETSQGYVAIAKMPSPGECNLKRNLVLPFILVLDQIRDPGNMGTIIRTAAAIGCEKILVSKGCVDIWEPKVIRSGMGGQFRIPILNNLTYEQIEAYLPLDTKLLFADNPKLDEKNHLFNIKKYDYTKINEINPIKKHTTLVIGGETMGLSKNIYGLNLTKIDVNNRAIINIPLENGVESLNNSVAFGVLAYELRKLLLSQ